MAHNYYPTPARGINPNTGARPAAFSDATCKTLAAFGYAVRLSICGGGHVAHHTNGAMVAVHGHGLGRYFACYAPHPTERGRLGDRTICRTVAAMVAVACEIAEL